MTLKSLAAFSLLALAFLSFTFASKNVPQCSSSPNQIDMKDLNFKSGPGRCTWYGQCAFNPTTSKPFNCYYNGPPKDPTSDKEFMALLQKTCPYLVGKDNPNPRVCCSMDQLSDLATQTQVARSLFARCPACMDNFMKHFCSTTCDPDMSMFMKPIDIDKGESGVYNCTLAGTNTTVTYIDTVTVYYENDYGQRIFNSCKDVVYPEQSGKVMDVLCGRKDCSAQLWFDFLGNPALDFDEAPFTMLYSTAKPTGDNMTLLNRSLHTCYEKSSYCCSCSDCPTVCPLPYVPEPSQYSLYVYSTIVGTIGLLLTMMVTGACFIWGVYKFIHNRKGSDYEELDSSTSSLSINADETTIDTNASSREDHEKTSLFCFTCVLGSKLEYGIKRFFYRWGKIASKYWFIVIPACLLVTGALSVGIIFFDVTTDPVKLWSAPNSQARTEKNYFDKNFSPFYRTEQVIIKVKPEKAFNYSLNIHGNAEGLKLHCGPALDQDVFTEAFNLQEALMNITGNYTYANGTSVDVRLKDICFKPLYPDYDDCTIESVFNYFQNNRTRIGYFSGFPTDVSWNASFHVDYCSKNPTALLDNNYDDDSKNIPCLGAYGGPIDPNTAFGDFEGTNYTTANVLLITFVVNNHVDDEKNGKAEAWEKAYLEYLKNYKSDLIEVSFTAERAITDEINRESETDVATIAISYVVMFLYIAIFLGHIRTLKTFFIDLKLMLGLFGVFIVLLAVLSSIGFLSYAKVEGSLIILEVVPFLVLAVGVDNLFIMVHSYERKRSKSPSLPVEELVGRALSDVSPSLLLTATSESAAFLLGAVSSMPAVRSFSLYAGVAVFINFLLQITAFVSVMALDGMRQARYRFDVLCCFKIDKSSLPDVREKPSLLFLFMKKIWTRYIVLHPLARPFWMLFFGFTFFASLASIPWVAVGLDQRQALPKDSYLQDYFSDMNAYLHIGPPVYFVIRDGFNYTDVNQQNKICTGADCKDMSYGAIITVASRISNHSRIAEPPSIWLDAYFEWLDPTSPCCGHAPDNPKKPCSSPNDTANSNCVHCLPPDSKRPNTSALFMDNLYHFLTANPDTSCAAAGHAAYNSAVVVDYDQMKIGATYAMTYHTILRNSSDFIAALKQARELSVNLTQELDHEVFAYSVFYVYYEQYLHIYRDMAINIGLSLGAVFLVTVFMLGFDVWGALMIISVVFMIIVHMGGVMVMANINANAVSLVNLVMTVGIAVEFCSHIVRWFMMEKGSRLERAHSSLANMGSSVVSGITCTKFLGVFILFFAKSQLFEVYYFRMYISMVCIGAAHGLIFLPILLSFVGPPVPCVKVPRAYPKDPRESSSSPERVPFSPQDNVQYSPNEKRPNDNGLYPQLPGNVNEIDPYGGYGAPTRPRQSPGAGEKTPLLP